MLKRISMLVVALMLVFTYVVPETSQAAGKNENAVKETQQMVNTQDMVETLDQYIYAKNNKLKAKHIPDSVYEEFGKENIKAMLKGIKNLNKSAESGELIITDNKTIFESDDTSYGIQGGINKVVYKWYGRVRYFSTASANDFEYMAYKVAAGAAGAGALAAFFSAGTTALFGGLTSWYYTNLALDVGHANSGHYRGIVLNVTWASVYWIRRQ